MSGKKTNTCAACIAIAAGAKSKIELVHTCDKGEKPANGIRRDPNRGPDYISRLKNFKG